MGTIKIRLKIDFKGYLKNEILEVYNKVNVGEDIPYFSVTTENKDEYPKMNIPCVICEILGFDNELDELDKEIYAVCGVKPNRGSIMYECIKEITSTSPLTVEKAYHYLSLSQNKLKAKDLLVDLSRKGVHEKIIELVLPYI